MTQLSTFQPPKLETDDQRRARIERERAIVEPGLFRLIDDAARSEWSVSWMSRQFNRSGFDVDPGFDAFIDNDVFEGLTDGLDEDLWPALDGAVSMSHGYRIREQMLQVQESRQRLAQAGLKGAALQVGAAIFDPGFIVAATGANFVAGPEASAALVATRAGRLSRLVRTGLVTGLAEAGVQSYVSSQDPQQGIEDVVYAGVGAAALGTGVESFRMLRAAKRLQRDIEFDDLVRHHGGDKSIVLDGNVLTPEGRTYFAEQLDPDRQRRMVDDLILASGLDEADDADLIQLLRESEPIDALEAIADPPGAGTRPPRDGKLAQDFDPSDVTDAPASASFARFSMSALFGTTDDPIVRRIGRAMVQDALPGKGGAPVRQSASEWTRRTVGKYLAGFRRMSDEHARDWMRRNGYNALRRAQGRIAFMEQVGHAVRAPRGTFADPAVNAVADYQRAAYREILDIAGRHGVKGLEDVDYSDTYFPRLYRYQELDKLVSRYDEEEVASMFAGAIRSLTPDIEDETLEAMSRGMVRTLRDVANLTDFDKSRIFAGDMAANLEDLLRSEGLDEDAIRRTLYQVERPGDTLTPRAKHRVRLDEGYVHRFSDGNEVPLSSLFTNDAERVFESYVRSVVGTSAMTEVYRLAGAETFEQMARRIERSLIDRKVSLDRRTSILKNMEFADQFIRGVSMNGDNEAARWLRRFRAYAFILLGGGFGMAALVDVAGAAAEIGFTSMLRRVDVIPRLVRQGIKGNVPDEVLDNLEAAFGLGTERQASRFTMRFDDPEDLLERGGRSLDRALRKGERFAADISGLAPITVLFQKWVGAATIDKFIRITKSGRVPSRKRLAMLGLTEDEGFRLTNAIRTEIAHERGVRWVSGRYGRKTPIVDPGKFQDQRAGALLVIAVNKFVRRTVQEPDIGQMRAWMHGDFAKLMLQFRSFSISSHEHQLLGRTVGLNDFHAYMAMAAQMLTGSMVYFAQTYVNSLGQDDPEEYRRERLNNEALALAGMRRGGFLGFLPEIVDFGLRLGDQDPIFDQRNTHLASGLFDVSSTPVGQIGNSLFRAISGSAGAALNEGEVFDQRDARNWLNALPVFQNLLGMRAFAETLMDRLPEDDD